MTISGEAEEPGQGAALLLAAAPLGRGRLIDAASALPALAAVAPAVLAGARTASLVELADPVDPQTVLTRLRTAADAPGHLSVYVAGQLHLDSRQHLPHIALARTTAATLRYTALPWAWFADVLGRRPAGATAVVDLVADREVCESLRAAGEELTLGPGARLYGRIAPPPARRTRASAVAPTYLRAYAALLRAHGRGLPAGQLHRYAAEQAGDAGGAVFLAPHDGEPVAPPAETPRATYAATTHAGPMPAAVPRSAPRASAVVPAPQAAPGRARAAGSAPTVLPAPVPASAPAPVPSADAPHAPRAAVPASSSPAQVSAHAPVPAPSCAPAVLPKPDRAAAPASARGSGPIVPSPAAHDPHQAVQAAARAGRFGEASAIAAAWESAALRGHGPGSPEAVHWIEVQADIAWLSHDPYRSCELWLRACDARLALPGGTDDPAFTEALDRAHHQWSRVSDAARAERLAQHLLALRHRVPGRRPGAVANIQQRLARLRAAAPGPAAR
ncbi:hypothetical protein [Streptomyces sp. NRRL F-5126]|uniref:hypothetical protein n=1 Tax=Streptomyces sp. NRRL F-5126 TaxID=1463857 RepID=UPI0004C80047|nr:hypothetical protein [Streptomyces sp. NRRL F-5126]